MSAIASPVSLLVIDDEAAIRRAIRASLPSGDYSIDEAGSGEAGLGAMGRRRFEIVLLDINMPGIGGIETCRKILQLAPNTGIVIISVRDTEEDKIEALEAGADDFITKPFRFGELVARMNAVHRRTRLARTQPDVLRAGDLELDVTNRLFWKAGHEIHLSQKEFDILAVLMQRPDTPIPHARLLQAVWGPEYGSETEYLRTYIKVLRRKIERDTNRPEYILTEPWVGYRFQTPLAQAAA
jgi:two-component system, OmpR family, KDP operon response regulator KdpE